MTKSRNVPVFVLIILMLVPLMYADDASIDITTGLDATNHQMTAEIHYTDVIRQHAVLWDTTHGVYLNYNPFVRYATLIANLADSGFTVTICSTGVHNCTLTEYDVILINLNNSWNSPYTQVEVDSLLSYYNQANQRVLLTGDMNFCEDMYITYADNIAFADNIFDWLAESGGIFILGDNTGCPNANINPVANAFNMTAGISFLSPLDLYFYNFANHPIFNGIDTIYYRAAGEVAATSPAEVIAWTSTNQPTIAALDQFVGVVEGQTGIVDISRLAISPNPFRHNTEVRGVTDRQTIRIFDVSGRLVAEQKESVIGGELREGVYFVRVNDFQTKKIVKLN